MMIPISESSVSSSLTVLSFSPGEGQSSVLGSVSVADAIYSLGTLEQGVIFLFLFLSAAVVEGNEINKGGDLEPQ